MVKPLTPPEEQVMKALWKLEKAFLSDILEEMAYLGLQRTTIATVLRVLIDKKHVGVKVVGRNHEYYPLISQADYSGNSISTIVENYFEGSYSNVLSFLMNRKKISIKEMEKALEQIKQLKKGSK